jgi:predicted metal-dependent HD superfamily phosphohydrolase
MNTLFNLETLVTHFIELPIISSTIHKLRHELPPEYCYHTAEHTEDVLKEALFFAFEDNLCYQDLYLLALAAAFHDIGFLTRPSNNETLGAEVARKELSMISTISEQEREVVSQMILDTTLQKTEKGLKQIPHTPLSRYLLDADVSNFGRVDFFEKAELVRKEIGSPDKSLFDRNTLALLEVHEWYSASAQRMRTSQKNNNLNELRRIIS